MSEDEAGTAAKTTQPQTKPEGASADWESAEHGNLDEGGAPLKIDGVKGESTDSTHKDWIE